MATFALSAARGDHSTAVEVGCTMTMSSLDTAACCPWVVAPTSFFGLSLGLGWYFGLRDALWSLGLPFGLRVGERLPFGERRGDPFRSAIECALRPISAPN